MCRKAVPLKKYMINVNCSDVRLKKKKKKTEHSDLT